MMDGNGLLRQSVNQWGFNVMDHVNKLRSEDSQVDVLLLMAER